MPFRIFDAVTPVAVFGVGGRLENLAAGLPRPFEVPVGIIDHDIKTLRGLPETSRTFVLPSRRSHHDDAVLEAHRRVHHRSVGGEHADAVPLEPERLRQPLQRGADVFVVEIRRDRDAQDFFHGPSGVNVGEGERRRIVKI